MYHQAVARLLAGAAFLIAAASACAAPQFFDLTLSDPDAPGGALDLVNPAVEVSNGTREVTPGDGSAIGDWLLASEFVDAELIAPLTWKLIVGIEAGAGTFSGYGPDGHYAFFNFLHDPALGDVAITGATITGRTTLTGGSLVVAGDVVRLFLGDMEMPQVCDQVTQVNCGSIELQLDFQQVPEPGTAGLLAAGLLALTVVARRRRAGTRG